MKANELRIGNWYDHGKFGEYHRMTGKDIWDFEGDPIDDIYYPIPLTEEWLLKFGFTKDNYETVENEWNMGELTFQYWKHNNTFHWVSSSGDVDVLIKHVHQLQNLCFALTSEELTIKNGKKI